MPSDYPAKLQVQSSDGTVVRYELAPEFHAKLSAAPRAPTDEVVQKLEENFTVVKGPASARAVAEGTALPVYRAQPSGMFAVPTGRLWIRFAEGIEAEKKREAMAKAGFSVEESPPWAKQGAWLRPSSGKIADALLATHHLTALDGVEHVEPQMLFASARKSGN
jgi:hypothetical protein